MSNDLVELSSEEGRRWLAHRVEGKLRELRAHYGKVQYRILYYGDIHGMFVLLHALRKRTARLPEREKRIAWQRLRDDEQRKKGGAL